jgi:hypothetical protein
VHEDVVGDGGADAVAPHLEGPVGLVVDGVEEPLRVGRPGGAVVGAGHLVGEVLAGAQVAEAQRVDLVAVGVDRPGEQVLVGADEGQPELQVVDTVGHGVDIQQDAEIVV